MNDTNRHPDLTELDAVRTGEASLEETAHVSACEACRSVLEDLRALSVRLQSPVTGIGVPPEVDRAILAAAASTRIARTALWRRYAAAAALLVAAGGGLWVAQYLSANPADIDGDGVADIVDAYRVALGIRSGNVRPEWDVDGNGAVDPKDVDAIAYEGVSLSGRRE